MFGSSECFLKVIREFRSAAHTAEICCRLQSNEKRSQSNLPVQLAEQGIVQRPGRWQQMQN